MQISRLTAWAVLCAWLPLAAVAQTPPPPAAAPDVLTTLRSKTSFSDEERSALRSWIDERAGHLRGDHDATAAAALGELRQALSAGTPAFRELLVGGFLDAARQSYKGAKPIGAARLLAFAASLNEPSASPLLIEALKDGRPGVRTAGAVGLRTLRSKLVASGGSTLSDAIAGLTEAAKTETAAPSLRAMFGALNYTDITPAPDARLLIAAHLEILDVRSVQLSDGRMRAEGSDVEALETLGKQLKSLGDEEKKRYLTILGHLLRYCVTRYVGELYLVKDKTSGAAAIEARNHVELLIETIEAQLPDLLAVAGKDKPSVLGALKTMKPDSSDRVNLKIEMNKWSALLEKATGQKFAVDESAEGDAPKP